MCNKSFSHNCMIILILYAKSFAFSINEMSSFLINCGNSVKGYANSMYFDEHLCFEI